MASKTEQVRSAAAAAEQVTTETPENKPEQNAAPSAADLTQRPGESPEAFVQRLQATLQQARADVASARAEGRLSLGENIRHSLKGTELTIVIDLSKSQGRSKSGRSTIVATTGGNTDIGGGIRLGINCFRM